VVLALQVAGRCHHLRRHRHPDTFLEDPPPVVPFLGGQTSSLEGIVPAAVAAGNIPEKAVAAAG